MLNVDDLLINEIKKDEKIIWADYPKFNFRFQAGDKFAVPFSILWTGTAIFMSINVLKAPFLIISIIPIVFSFLGLYLLFGRFIHDIMIRRNTYYCLTNMRLLIFKKSGSINTISKDLSSISYINIIVNSKGVGSIYFSENIDLNVQMNIPGIPKPVCIDYINDVRRIYNLIKDAKDLVM